VVLTVLPILEFWGFFKWIKNSSKYYSTPLTDVGHKAIGSGWFKILITASILSLLLIMI